MDKTSDWKFSEPCVIDGLKGVGDITVCFKAYRGLKNLNCAITKITLLEYLGSDGDSNENLLNTYRKHKQRIHGFAEKLIENRKLHEASKTYLITSELALEYCL